MKKTLLLITILFQGILQAQNLVPNPSFEEYDTCPDWLDQISRCQNWYKFVGTPDYFNACAPDSSHISIPNNSWGYQYPATGNAYTGVQTYFTREYREVIGAKLLSPLKIGTLYFASFKVSRAKNLKPGSGLINNCASNNIGILFSTKPYYINLNGVYGPPPMHNFAHLYSNLIISDTINWIEISGSFIADSTYQYIGIGNFFDDAHTDTLHVNYNDWGCRAFYYIDNVCLSEQRYCYFDGLDVFKPVKQKPVVFPNPADKQINIRCLSKIISYKIFNLSGEVINSSEIISRKPSEIININCSGFPNGLYFISILNENFITVKKVLINH